MRAAWGRAGAHQRREHSHPVEPDAGARCPRWPSRATAWWMLSFRLQLGQVPRAELLVALHPRPPSRRAARCDKGRSGLATSCCPPRLASSKSYSAQQSPSVDKEEHDTADQHVTGANANIWTQNKTGNHILFCHLLYPVLSCDCITFSQVYLTRVKSNFL